MTRRFSAVVFAICSVILWTPAKAQVYPADFAQVLVANGIANPTVMAFTMDGRIFVAQQNGSLRVIKNNALLSTPFATLTVTAVGERGLIGIALDPDFQTNNFIYLYYTVPGSPAHNRISRFTANGDVAAAGSEMVVLELDPLSSATNHNGGAMHFGTDGKLYVAVGENANSANAQNLDTYHGKLLRINKDGSVPAGNPFPTGSEQRKRVWAFGLRNPYTFSVHPQTGRIFVNDVGQGTWEEINDVTTPGLNFGWPSTEGTFNQITYPNFTNPLYAYSHGSGDGKGCAITGGTFFNPLETNYPAPYAGRYFYQDLCGNWINTLDLSSGMAVRAPFATGISGNGLSITLGPDGNLYYLSRSAGALYKIIYNNETIPYITTQPQELMVADGRQAHFSVSALGSVPLFYQWQKDGVDIPDATSSTFTIPSVEQSDNGIYRVLVTNTAGEAISEGAMLTVVMNQLPVAEIITPAADANYTAGTTLNFSGRGIDAEDGVLPASALSWTILFHHDMHDHDQPPIHGVANGSFVIPNEGETSDNVFYRIILATTDLNGFEGKDTVDVLPRKSTLHFETNPPGLKILLEGQPLQTPVSIMSVEGMLRTVGTISPQTSDGYTHTFESWSNGGTETQTLATPPEDLILTAQFSTVVGVEGRSGGDFAVYPNPTEQDYVWIHLQSAVEQTVTVRLVDALSRVVVLQQQPVFSGENTFAFYLHPAAQGLYSLLVEGKDAQGSARLLISR